MDDFWKDSSATTSSYAAACRERSVVASEGGGVRSVVLWGSDFGSLDLEGLVIGS